MTALYLFVAMMAVAVGLAATVRLRRATSHGFLIGVAGAVPFSILFMIKLRCSIGAYPCGFMSFAGGLTWHIMLGLAAYIGLWVISASGLHLVGRSIGLWQWIDILGRASAPLSGLWIAVVWESLPIRVIHNPLNGGLCPDLQVVCHDTPLFGWGGLAYWASPLLLWAASTVIYDIVLTMRTAPDNAFSRSSLPVG